MYKKLGSELIGFGGHLKCETCERTLPLNGVGKYLKSGWPTCHGYTMTWITQKEIDEKEVTP